MKQFPPILKLSSNLHFFEKKLPRFELSWETFDLSTFCQALSLSLSLHSFSERELTKEECIKE